MNEMYEGLSTVIDLISLPDPGIRFEIQQLLGEGTFGEVYKVVYTTLLRKVYFGT